MKGKIVKGIGGFYYVRTAQGEVYACRAKGIFRLDKKKPLVGDDVEISVQNPEKKEGNVDALAPRRNELLRPAVANVDQVLLVFAAACPKPNRNLLDRFLIFMKKQEIPVILCFNKQDLVSAQELEGLVNAYRESDCEVFGISVQERQGLERLRKMLEGKTTVVAGPSGVGKSSLTNYLCPQIGMEVGEISRKIDRGKHTTRHTELVCIGEATYFLDTPGFTSLILPQMEKEELRFYYPEFAPYEGSCRFQGCVHLSEPGCKVREALAEGKIDPLRYENYQIFYEEIRDRRKY